MTLEVEGRSIPVAAGDTIALALLRAGIHPGGGGVLCLDGDCASCLCVVDGVPYTRACTTGAVDGMRVERQGARALAAPPPPGPPARVARRHAIADVVVVGGGRSGTAAAAAARAAGRSVLVLDAAEGAEVVAIHDHPRVVARTPDGLLHVTADEVVVATGAAEEHPVCPGSELAGLYTARAGARLAAAGLLPAAAVTVAGGARPEAFAGRDGRVCGVTVRAPDGTTTQHACDAVVLGLGTHPRDALARQGAGLAVRAVGSAATAGDLPPAPVAGVVCPCTGTTVDDLDAVWEHGFREMELFKRATLAGTGFCQGAVCLPHLRAYLAARGGRVQPAFTARPLARPLTLAETMAGVHHPPVRRTALDAEHRALGARMERFGGWWRPWSYGDAGAEYRAVREAVSLGDVSTLGKVLVSGPDAVAFLERIYPCRVGDLERGRIRYALVLDERGYVFDDGVIVREDERRFWLTFTTGGASGAEAWLRDWAEAFGHDVRIADRTAALAAINVTGPLAGELLRRCGLADPPGFLRATAATVCGVPCTVLRLGFTGEASFELHHDADRAVALWRGLMAAGADLGIAPHGLDALLTLRLEKGHIIVGMDTDFDSTPRRLGMAWAVRRDGVHDFLGGDALRRIDGFPLDRLLIGLELDGPPPVEGAPLHAGGRLCGNVTSARWSPALGRSVLLAFVDLVGGAPPDAIVVDGRPARPVPLPFYDPEGSRARA